MLVPSVNWSREVAAGGMKIDRGHMARNTMTQVYLKSWPDVETRIPHMCAAFRAFATSVVL